MCNFTSQLTDNLYTKKDICVLDYYLKLKTDTILAMMQLHPQVLY